MPNPQPVRSMHQYALEIQTEDGKVIGSRLINPDWSSAVESARFEWWSQSRATDVLYDHQVRIEPIRVKGEGLPAAGGFRVIASGGTSPTPGDPVDFPKSYFNHDAARIAQGMVAEGLLTKGQAYRFGILVFPPASQARSSTPVRPAGFAVEKVVDRLPVPRSVAFASYTQGARTEGETFGQDFPLFLPRRIVDEADELTERAGGVETGGILIGRLIRETETRKPGLDITAQIPARRAEGASSKLTFTAECWADVRAAVALRRSDEVMLGWWHSHPAKAWCNPKCTPEQRRNCPLNHQFFSEEDIHLHQTVFPRAYQCALVVTHTESGMKHAMFGWRAGSVARRGFTVTQPSPQAVGT